MEDPAVQKVFEAWIGKKVNAERLEPIGEPNGCGSGEHEGCDLIHVYNYDYLENDELCDELREKFGVDELLGEYWDEGIIYCIGLYLREGVLEDGYVFKYEETDCGHFRSNIEYLDPDPEELEVTARVLEYLFEK